MKKTISILLATILAAAAFAGCGSSTADNSREEGSGTASNTANAAGSSFRANSEITVVSREDGSGTRGAFIELFGVEVKDGDGNSTDRTTKEAIISNKTDVMLTNVAGDTYAIGYVSLGSLNDSVKAMPVDGADATVENINNGSYKISRPFHIATGGDVTEVTQDFIDFILSSEGQQVVTDGYIPVDDGAAAYAGSAPSGKIVVAGSSSVTPIMEKLKEAYLVVNPGASIEIQQSDSSTGMQAAIDGTCDIGMASRDLKDSELENGLVPTVIAIDGIAVIVNNGNPVESLTSEQVRQIFTGEVTAWDEVA